jgi:hypothetical protein
MSGQFRVELSSFDAAATLGTGVVPFDFESIAPAPGRPEILRQHRDARRDLHDIDDAGDDPSGSRVVTRDARTEARRRCDHRRQHPGLTMSIV